MGTEQHRRAALAGLAMAVASAACFGMSGSFATALVGAGWSPAAVVRARMAVAALLLTPVALRSLRRGIGSSWAELWQTRRHVLIYGVVAVSGGQLCYFEAVAHLSVGVALLLEYMGVFLVVAWMWAVHGQRPGRLTTAGAGCAVVGLCFVLDLTNAGRLNAIGILWAAGAAVGLAYYFVASARSTTALDPLALTWSSLVVGVVAIQVAGLIGILPMHMTTGDVTLRGARMSWVVPVLGVAIISTVTSYLLGVRAARVLGARLASFVGLLEVVAAVLWAWLLLGQLPHAWQLFGGVLVLAGVALVRAGEPTGQESGTSGATAECTERIALAPSPTADATRFIDPQRTSPTANTQGTLVS